uniref:Homeobox domain-containing protein n=1 Tax=Kalanchoe fedtschenkoi TaxID=63787 RepID=A0A7N0U5H7_KALFE
MYGDCQVVLSSMGMNNSNAGSSSSSSNLNLTSMNMNMGMGMGMFSSDSAAANYFSSPPSNNIQSGSSFNFMSPSTLLMPPLPFHSSYPPLNILTPEESDQLKGKLDEMESGSGSDQIEALSANDALDTNNNTDQNQQPQPKKKRYHRHTAHQIQEMEAVFKECPHPDDKQRMRLSQELGLKPRQIKFWFQNRRTQMKVFH